MFPVINVTQAQNVSESSNTRGISRKSNLVRTPERSGIRAIFRHDYIADARFMIAMSPSRGLVSGLVAILTLLFLGLARTTAEQLPIRTYTTADGLARDRVYKIVADPRGFLWFCTYDGISRFDGYEFVNYSVADGLPQRVVYDLLIPRQGDYWVATSGGIARFNPFASTYVPKFKSYVPNSRSGSEIVVDLYEDSAGTIWAGTSSGLFRLRDNAGDVQFRIHQYW